MQDHPVNLLVGCHAGGRILFGGCGRTARIRRRREVFDELLQRVGASIENEIVSYRALLGRYLRIRSDMRWIDDGSVQTCLNAVMQEYGVQYRSRFCGKPKRNIGNAKYCADTRQLPLDEPDSLDRLGSRIDPLRVTGGERKLEVARKIYDIAVGEYGLAPEDLLYDALTCTLASGEAEWIDSAAETIEGIRLIKRELPGVGTILGVSNVSFGLTTEARSVLNSVFLHHCVQAGLDAAIVNPAHIRPYAEISTEERAVADDLVFNRRPDALQKFIEYFSATPDAGGSATAAKEDPTAGMTADEKIHWMVLHRKKEGIEDALDDAGVRQDPVRVLNGVLLPAMKDVGDKFGAGELILPFVLQSAEVMKKAVQH